MRAPPLAVVAAASSHLGGRTFQEDASLLCPALGLFAVADGMGAGSDGRIAADLALTTLREHHQSLSATPEPDRLLAAARAASAAVFARTEQARTDWENRHLHPERLDPARTRWLGLGTTLVALRFVLEDPAPPRAHITHAGDSRAYLFRAGTLSQLTTDHRLVDEARRAGRPESEIATLPASIIVEALGMHANVRFELANLDVEPGDTFLLSSDGLTDTLSHLELTALLNKHAGARSPEVVANALVEQALQRRLSLESLHESDPSHSDNITVIVLRVAPCS